jgi:NAD(P)-dependent dehydrogenase (short-subunit alcohol dehydrogenase family)
MTGSAACRNGTPWCNVLRVFELAGRVAVITGASSGLGERFARTLHAAGVAVVVTARREERLSALVNELGADSAAYLVGDVCDDAHLDAVIALAQTQFGRLDIVIANAGGAYSARAEDEPMSKLRALVELNLTAVISLCRAAGPTLIAQGAGSVILVSSIYGLVSVGSGEARGSVGYAATKGALANLTRELASQWGHAGVRVNALAPGFFPTELNHQLEDPDEINRIRSGTLLRRPGEIHELDGPLLFLASDASSYTTGHTLVVDGGWTAV